MVEISHVIKDPLGFHARLVMRVAAEAQRWESSVVVSHGSHRAEGTDIMGLMGLEAGQGAELRVQIEGADEQDAAEFLAHMLRGM